MRRLLGIMLICLVIGPVAVLALADSTSGVGGALLQDDTAYMNMTDDQITVLRPRTDIDEPVPTTIPPPFSGSTNVMPGMNMGGMGMGYGTTYDGTLATGVRMRNMAWDNDTGTYVMVSQPGMTGMYGYPSSMAGMGMGTGMTGMGYGMLYGTGTYDYQNLSGYPLNSGMGGCSCMMGSMMGGMTGMNSMPYGAGGPYDYQNLSPYGYPSNSGMMSGCMMGSMGGMGTMTGMNTMPYGTSGSYDQNWSQYGYPPTSGMMGGSMMGGMGGMGSSYGMATGSNTGLPGDGYSYCSQQGYAMSTGILGPISANSPLQIGVAGFAFLGYALNAILIMVWIVVGILLIVYLAGKVNTK